MQRLFLLLLPPPTQAQPVCNLNPIGACSTTFSPTPGWTCGDRNTLGKPTDWCLSASNVPNSALPFCFSGVVLGDNGNWLEPEIDDLSLSNFLGAINGDCRLLNTLGQGSSGNNEMRIEFVPQQSETYLIDTFGSSVDTIMWITECVAINKWVDLGCDDNLLNQSGWSLLLLPLVAGHVYHISVEGYQMHQNRAPFLLNINTLQSCTTRFDAQTCSGQPVDECLVNTLRGTILGATTRNSLSRYEPPNTSPDWLDCSNRGVNTADWTFSLIAGTDALYTFQASNISTLITVRMCDGLGGVVVACSNNGQAQVELQMDNVYTITVEGNDVDFDFSYSFKQGGTSASPTSNAPTTKPTTPGPTTRQPTLHPSTRTPTKRPTRQPTIHPTSSAPTMWPTRRPTAMPTARPTTSTG